MKGLISTIIPVYNRAAMVNEAVRSVIDQTYRPIEIIIVDDGSNDDTAPAADRLALDYPAEIKVIHQKNAGPGLAREAGKVVARGEFIQYLDSDDVLLPGKFELQTGGLKSHPECGVSYGKTRYRYSDGTTEKMPWKGSGIRVETMFPSFLLSRWWDTPTPLYRSSLCREAGPWTDLRLEEDWEYDCRVASLGVRLHYCDEFIAEVRDHEKGRLCKGSAIDAARLSERARAHKLIFSHAQRAGITDVFPEMKHYARELFLLSRQCGAAGLPGESKELFELSRKASGEARGSSVEFRLYEALANVIGWKALGRLSCYADRLKK